LFDKFMLVKIRFSQPTLIYLGVASLFLAGMWLTLEMGTDFLHAAPDLHGRWAQATDDDSRGESFTIEQSGRYLQLTSSAGKPVDLVMTKVDPDPDRRYITLAGDGWTVITAESDSGTGVQFTFTPPSGEKSPPSGLYRPNSTHARN
jgi:hypothetical protein